MKFAAYQQDNEREGIMLKKKLYRSRRDSVIGGVCGGIADYFDIDSTLIRLAFILILLARGAGLLAYIIAWILIPGKPQSFYDENGKEIDVVDIESDNDKDEDSKNMFSNRRRLLGIILIIMGGIFLIDVWVPHFYWQRFWPFIIIALGIGILIKGVGDNGQKER